jgi:hypothetical protein
MIALRVATLEARLQFVVDLGESGRPRLERLVLDESQARQQRVVLEVTPGIAHGSRI